MIKRILLLSFASRMEVQVKHCAFLGVTKGIISLALGCWVANPSLYETFHYEGGGGSGNIRNL